jgi:hypothetical protein
MGHTFSLTPTRDVLGLEVVSTWRRSLVKNLIVGGLGGLGCPPPLKERSRQDSVEEGE